MKTILNVSSVVAAAAVAGLVFAVPAAADTTNTAGPSVTQSLTPAPPPFYICKAVGNGTICQGSRTFVVDPYEDFVCNDGTTIYDQGTVQQVATRYYDADGNLTRRVIHELWTEAHKSNPLTGLTAEYSQADTITDVLSAPGDVGSATETVTGQANITVPGVGAVLLNSGRTVWAPDGTLDFRAGPQDFLDYFLGNTDVVDKLCAALGTS